MIVSLNFEILIGVTVTSRLVDAFIRAVKVNVVLTL